MLLVIVGSPASAAGLRHLVDRFRSTGITALLLKPAVEPLSRRPLNN
jgi:hypothetical protein